MDEPVYLLFQNAELELYRAKVSRDAGEAEKKFQIAVNEALQEAALEFRDIRRRFPFLRCTNQTVILYVWCASGQLPVFGRRDGTVWDQVALRGREMLDFLRENKSGQIYVPQDALDDLLYPITCQRRAREKNGGRLEEERFDPVPLVSICTMFFPADPGRQKTVRQAFHKGRWGSRSARAARGRYYPDRAAAIFVEKGLCTQEHVNRVLGRNLPHRSKHFADYYLT